MHLSDIIWRPDDQILSPDGALVQLHPHTMCKAFTMYGATTDGIPYYIKKNGHIQPVNLHWVVSRSNYKKVERYLYFRCNKYGPKFIGKTMYVQRFILEIFGGFSPKPKMHAAHENGVYHDNHITNLSWKTQRDNELDKFKQGKMKMNDAQVWEAFRLYEVEGIEPKFIAYKFNVSEQFIQRVFDGKNYAEVCDAYDYYHPFESVWPEVTFI